MSSDSRPTAQAAWGSDLDHRPRNHSRGIGKPTVQAQIGGRSFDWTVEPVAGCVACAPSQARGFLHSGSSLGCAARSPGVAVPRTRQQSHTPPVLPAPFPLTQLSWHGACAHARAACRSSAQTRTSSLDVPSATSAHRHRDTRVLVPVQLPRTSNRCSPSPTNHAAATRIVAAAVPLEAVGKHP